MPLQIPFAWEGFDCRNLQCSLWEKDRSLVFRLPAGLSTFSKKASPDKCSCKIRCSARKDSFSRIAQKIASGPIKAGTAWHSPSWTPVRWCFWAYGYYSTMHIPVCKVVIRQKGFLQGENHSKRDTSSGTTYIEPSQSVLFKRKVPIEVHFSGKRETPL